MKRNFTLLIISALIIFTFLGVNNLYAQTLYDINASGVSFTPSSITINVGDTLRWTNTQGTHNVNGTTASYPSNPESFGNAVAGAGWVFTHVFHSPGTYNYKCDLHAGSGMTGTITVTNIAGIESLSPEIKTNITLYPQPASTYLNIDIADEIFTNNNDLEIVVYNLLGKEVMRRTNINSQSIKLEIQELKESMYILQLINDSRIIETKRIIKQ